MDPDLEIDYDKARGIIYGMPYAEWRARYQSEATPDQKAPSRRPTRTTTERLG